MKTRLVITLLTAGGIGVGLNTPAHAIGCFSGGLAGAVAGHMAHHGVLGALGGCVAGHEYNKHQKRAAMQNQNQSYDNGNGGYRNNNGNGGYNSNRSPNGYRDEE